MLFSMSPAGSIWGGPRFVQSWKMTGNGMEGAAAPYNDGLLALDEISQRDVKVVGEIVYARKGWEARKGPYR
jgi:putative DNA primase/helicase